MKHQCTLFYISYKELPITDDFKSFFNSNGIKTLKELIEIKTLDMFKIPGFTAHFWKELIDVLEENEVLALLR